CSDPKPLALQLHKSTKKLMYNNGRFSSFQPTRHPSIYQFSVPPAAVWRGGGSRQTVGQCTPPPRPCKWRG
ncbi:hypothetical protein Csa_013425, partial [Cucumis sativus]